MTHEQRAALQGAVIKLDAAGLDARRRRLVIQQMRHYETIGEAAFWALKNDRDNESLHGMPGWPECECGGCPCTSPATCTDDGGVPVCSPCSDYTVDGGGEVHCSCSCE